jgi:hypothetical protein
VIHGASVVTLHAQVALNSNNWLQVAPADENIWLVNGEDEGNGVHVCAAAAADSKNRTKQIQAMLHLFLGIDFKTTTQERFFRIYRGRLTL